MPTSTLDGYNFFNVGALTTTWTAPASCTTGIRLAGVADARIPQIAQYYELCDFSQENWVGGPRWGNCIPEGEQVDEYVRSQTDSGDPHTFVDYHSPGLHCPASWTTAGIAVKGAEGSISATGAFAPTSFLGAVGLTSTEYLSVPTAEPWPNKMAHALNEGETAVLCCPSGYSAWEYGNCYSNFPIESVTSSTVCAPMGYFPFTEVPDTFTYNNELVTGVAYSPTGTTLPEVTATETLIFENEDGETPSGVSGDVQVAPRSLYTGHTQIPMVVLVRGGNDDDSAGDNNGGSDNNGGNSEGDGDDGNGGVSFKPSLGAVMAAWGVAGLLGALLVAPF